MSENVTLNGNVYIIPDPGDTGWGQNLTNFFVAIPAGVLQKSAGLFTLTGELDFGAGYGVKSLYYKTRTANIATAGQIRLAVGDTIDFRNNANSSNLALAVNGSDQLTFNGSVLATGGTVNSGTAGRLSLYATSSQSLSDTYVQNAHNITVAIATQGSRSADLAITLPNPGNAVTTTNILLDKGNQSASGTLALTATSTTALVVGSAAFAVDSTNGTGSAGAVGIGTTTPGTVLDVNDNTSGASTRIRLANSSNASNTSVGLNLIAAGGSCLSARTAYVSGHTYNWSEGVDIQDGDKYKVSQNTELGTNDYLIIKGDTKAVAIHGTNTNDSPAAGFVGEVISSAVTNVSLPTTGQYGDLTSISLTAGNWLVSAQLFITGASILAASITLGISSHSGNSGTGLVVGDNLLESAPPTGAGVGFDALTIAAYQIQLATTTTIYAKMAAAYTSGTQAFNGRITALRIS